MKTEINLKSEKGSALESSVLIEKDQKQEESEILDKMHNGLCKALMLGIAYCASIGGVGMLTGTGPNLISANQAMDKYGFSINFVNWASFATPLSITMTAIAWVILVWMFLLVEGKFVYYCSQEFETKKSQ